jgi:hypothetical protein
MTIWEKAALAGAIAAWSIGMWSLFRAMSLGRMAADSLTPAERNNYLLNLLLFPARPWAEALLRENGGESHRKAIAHVRIVHRSFLGFALRQQSPRSHPACGMAWISLKSPASAGGAELNFPSLECAQKECSRLMT